MKLKNARKPSGLKAMQSEFLVRLYRWAREDTLEQFGQEFPRLKSLKSGPALRYLEFLGNLSKNDRPRFVLAKLKQSHNRAAALLNEPLSFTEKKLLDSFYQGREVAMNSGQRAYVGSQVETALNDLKVLSPAAFKIDKSLLRLKIEGKLCQVFGESRQRGSTNNVLLNMRNGPWTITTCVDTPQTFQLRYYHSIRFKGRSYLIERTSCFNWMGVKMETYWNYLTMPDLNTTAESVVEMCQVFFEALPKLLKDLA